MAAVLACGEGAVLSGRSAATLHGLLKVRGGPVHVTVPRRTPIARRGIRVHRSTCLAPADCTIVDRIPCTIVPVTLLSLAAGSPRNVLESACNQAEIEGVLDMRAIGELLRRRGGHPGSARLRAVLDLDDLGLDRTKSPLEKRFLALMQAGGLPAPAVNDSIAIPGEELQFDFVWYRERVVVELDGWKTHRTRTAFRDDRRRDQLLKLAGWDVVRFTSRDLNDPGHVDRVVRAMLGDRAAMDG